MARKKKIRVFMASPGDLSSEREVFFETLPQIGESLRVELIPTGYEIVGAAVGERPQDLINKEVDTCDVFIATFHRRWGQTASDSVASGSYTEEEFTRALRRHSATGAPAIICLFKNVDLNALADPGPQLSKVLEFKRRLENSGKVLYRTFESETDFSRELAQHLTTFVKKPRTTNAIVKRRVLLPVPADDQPDVERNRDLALVKQAVDAAAKGRLEEAEALFARLSQTTVTVPVLDVAKNFFEQVGNTEASQAVLDRKLALVRDRRLAAQEHIASLMAHGWVEGMIAERLSVTPEDEREITEKVFRTLFGPKFFEIMLDVMAENFTLGELRALTKFYAGEGATIANKMAYFMGRVLPPIVEQMQVEAMKELGIEELAGSGAGPTLVE